MKNLIKKVFVVGLLMIVSTSIFAQKKWFTLFTDSAQLVTNATGITTQFIKDVKAIKPTIDFNIKTVLNTTPYLIYFDERGEKSANLPIWQQVIPEQKKFFYEVAGGEKTGKKAFGLFFNGFYLPHELAHALQFITEKKVELSYANEYFANTVAILWWRKNGNNKQLKQCYKYAKKMWSKLENPVPQGETLENYFTKNYEAASQNPYSYGYMQFKQFIDIYENKSLPNFDEFVKNYLKLNANK